MNEHDEAIYYSHVKPVQSGPIKNFSDSSMMTSISEMSSDPAFESSFNFIFASPLHSNCRIKAWIGPAFFPESGLS